MKNLKQKFYQLVVIGTSIFVSLILFFFTFVFDSTFKKDYEFEQFEIANITAQTADLFWKGYSENSDFKIRYRKNNSEEKFEELIPRNVYNDFTYEKGYMFKVPLSKLESNQEYVVQVLHKDKKIYERNFNTKNEVEKIEFPIPTSGKTFVFDWIKISTDSDTYIINADYDGRWSIDKNIVGDNFETKIYASSMIRHDNPIESYLIGKVYAIELANCDTFQYSRLSTNWSYLLNGASMDSKLLLNSGASQPQYERCYNDVVCEADKNGINPVWTLATWMHESNASDYGMSGSYNLDFGVACCGVPDKDFQQQLGFFLNLSHDPCECGSSGCTKEQYYCCWAYNYLYGTKTKYCLENNTMVAYLNGMIYYYNLAMNTIVQGDIKDNIARLPMPLKRSSGENVTCGEYDAVNVYLNDISVNPDDPEDPEEPTDGICCALKLDNREDFQGDWENNTEDTCEEIWDVGREVHGGIIQSSDEITSANNRTACEKSWSGICCNINSEYKWLPEVNCSTKVTQYSTYQSCINANEDPTEPTKFCHECSSSYLYTHAYDFSAGEDNVCFTQDDITWNYEKYYVCDCCTSKVTAQEKEPDSELYARNTSNGPEEPITYQQCLDKCKEGNVVCNDGVVQGNEKCDPPGSPCIVGDEIGSCSSDCNTCEPPDISCGDSKVEGNEECDPPESACITDGQEVGQCSDGCTCEPLAQDPKCGDNNVDDNEECDPPGSACITGNQIGECSEECSCIAPNSQPICCAIKVEGEDDFYSYFEENTTQSCLDLIDNSGDFNNKNVDYVLEIPEAEDVNSCQLVRQGVCCNKDGEYQWLPTQLCNNIIQDYTTYDTCMATQEPVTDFSLQFERGYNFIGWPAQDDQNPVSASDIIEKPPVLLVGSFKNGIWDSIMYKESGSTKGADFILEPGYGYLIITTTDFSFDFTGRPSSDFDWQALQGWQFVDGSVFEPYRDNKSLILSFNQARIKQVALWNKIKSGFDYFFYSNTTGEEYGELKEFTKDQGVFVKIQ